MEKQVLCDSWGEENPLLTPPLSTPEEFKYRKEFKHKAQEQEVTTALVAQTHRGPGSCAGVTTWDPRRL